MTSKKKEKAEAKTLKLEGTLRVWSMDKTGKAVRRYLVWSTTYGEMRDFVKPDPFRAEKGTGEQRSIVKPHVNRLKTEMLAGTYTPTTFSAGLRPRHQKAVEFDVGLGMATINLSSADPIPSTDGNHRATGIADIYADAVKAEDLELQTLLLALPIEVLILLDGDTQRDFLNLQMGRSVDAAHMLSMKAKQGMLAKKDADFVDAAIATAKVLSSSKESPFEKQIRFGDVGTAIPITTLCARGASDICTSLVGLAKVCKSDGDELTPAQMADYVIEVHGSLSEMAPELLQPGMPLTPPPNGTRGSATMLVGLATLLAYRVLSDKREEADETDLEALVESAKSTFNRQVDGNLAGAVKRALLGEFAADFFSDVNCDKHEGIPVGLIKTLSASTFKVSKLSKATATEEATPPTPNAPVQTQEEADAAYAQAEKDYQETYGAEEEVAVPEEVEA